MIAAGRLLLVVCLLAANVRAEETPAPAPTPASAPSGDLNFNLFEEKPKLTVAEEAAKARHEADIARKVTLRRKLLVAHQGVGFATLGLLAATLVLGTLNYVDKYGGGNDSGDYYLAHTIFAGAATTSFAVTGILALAAPNPYPKPRRFDTAMLHKILMGLATAGFVASAILGPVVASREGHLDQRGFALAHLLVGYGTFAFMGAGTIAFVFK